MSLGTIGAYAFQNSRLISEGYSLGLGDQMVIRAAIRVLRGESFSCYCKPQRRATWPRPKQPLFWPLPCCHFLGCGDMGLSENGGYPKTSRRVNGDNR